MLTSLRLYLDRFTGRFLCTSARRIALIFILTVFACTKQELPDLGPRLPQTAAPDYFVHLPGLSAGVPPRRDLSGGML